MIPVPVKIRKNLSIAMEKIKSTARYSNHIYRRLIHISMMLIPWIFEGYVQYIQPLMPISNLTFGLLLIMLAISVESIRLYFGTLFFAQRPYERHQLSSLFWTACAILAVLAFTPEYHGSILPYTFPLITSMAIGDPLLGECRAYKLPTYVSILITLILLMIVWFISFLFFSIPAYAIFLMPCLAILGEYPSSRYIDDNALMLGLPLMALIIIQYL